MATHYVNQRREQPEHAPQPTHRESRASFMHHVAWGIVCVLLITAMGGMWVYAQSLQRQNGDLRQQLAVAKEPPTTCKVKEAWAPAQSKELALPTKDGERKFIVHTPSDFKDGHYYPLVLFYTGKGASALGSELSFGLDALPVIMVYPHPTAGVDGYTAWRSAPYASDADDVGFTAAILDKLQSDMCIDKTRIYATGFSNGGGFASLLSCELPNRIAAYAVVAGAMYAPDSDCTPDRPSPMISIHGDNDIIVPYDGVTWRNLPPVYDWTAWRAKQEKCGTPFLTNTDPRLSITTWSKCRGGAEIQNVRVNGGNHSWGEVPNEMLWQFMSRFTL